MATPSSRADRMLTCNTPSPNGKCRISTVAPSSQSLIGCGAAHCTCNRVCRLPRINGPPAGERPSSSPRVVEPKSIKEGARVNVQRCAAIAGIVQTDSKTLKSKRTNIARRARQADGISAGLFIGSPWSKYTYQASSQTLSAVSNNADASDFCARLTLSLHDAPSGSVNRNCMSGRASTRKIFPASTTVVR
ncbi:hypothetical protein D3C85_1250790 [compost metagenome]